jgi:hypothetical protein
MQGYRAPVWLGEALFPCRVCRQSDKHVDLLLSFDAAVLSSSGHGFRYGNTVVSRNPHRPPKSVEPLLPGLNFIPVQDCTGKGSLLSGPFRFSGSKNGAVLTKEAAI